MVAQLTLSARDAEPHGTRNACNECGDFATVLAVRLQAHRGASVNLQADQAGGAHVYCK